MSTTRLNKWGNSQGVIIPKHLCDYIGLEVGDQLEVTVNAKTGTIELAHKEPMPAAFKRVKKKAS